MICGQDDVAVYIFLALSGSKKVSDMLLSYIFIPLTMQHLETTVLLLSCVCDIHQFDEQDLFVLQYMKCPVWLHGKV